MVMLLTFGVFENEPSAFAMIASFNTSVKSGRGLRGRRRRRRGRGRKKKRPGGEKATHKRERDRKREG